MRARAVDMSAADMLEHKDIHRNEPDEGHGTSGVQATLVTDQPRGEGERRDEDDLRDEAERRQENSAAKAARVGVSWTRVIVGIPAIGLFLSSIALVVQTTFAVVTEIVHSFSHMPGTGLVELAIEFVEFTDMYLLAVVLYIMALGLVTLFITDEIPLPSWLAFRDFDDLKERLVSVIVVMLGVFFLGEVLKGAHGLDLVWLAASIAVIIAALTVFVRLVFKAHH